MSLMICTTEIIPPHAHYLIQKFWHNFFFFFAGNSEQHQSSEMTELHRLRRELQDEQDRVQRLSAQLSTNVRWFFFQCQKCTIFFMSKGWQHCKSNIRETLYNSYHPIVQKEKVGENTKSNYIDSNLIDIFVLRKHEQRTSWILYWNNCVVFSVFYLVNIFFISDEFCLFNFD